MKMNKTYKSEALFAIHETISDLKAAGAVDLKTMRHFDKKCLTRIEDFSPEKIKLLRTREKVSQIVFAHYLNVSKESISQWERGIKRANGPSLKLLSLAKKNGLAAIA